MIRMQELPEGDSILYIHSSQTEGYNSGILGLPNIPLRQVDAHTTPHMGDHMHGCL